MRKLLVAMLVLVGLLAGCQAKKGEFGTRNMVTRSALSQADLDHYWHLKISLPRLERMGRMYLLGDCLYVLTSRQRLLCVDANTGVWKWSATISERRIPMYDPIHADGLVLPDPRSETREPKPFDVVMVGTLTDLVILDRVTGQQLKQIALPYPAMGTGATDGTYFYYGSNRPWYHAIDLTSGLTVWGLPADGAITAPLQFFEGVLYVTTEAGTAYATAVGARGQTLWTSREQQSVTMHGPVTAASYVDQRGLFVPCEDNRLYAYDRSTGRPLWSPLVCQGPLREPVQASAQSLFQHVLRDRFYAADVATGTTRWTLPTGQKVLAMISEAGSSKACVLDADNNLLVVDEVLGQTDATVPMTGLDLFVGNTATAAIYAGTANGHLVCIRPRSAGRLMPAQTPAQ